jgi:lipopolysaccharide export system protein LptA
MLKCLKISILCLLFFASAAFALDISEVKILSAEKLDYKDGNSTLIGNVKIQLSEYLITAPKVFIDSDDSGKPIKARFVEEVNLESDQMNITAPLMEIDLQNTLFKCFANEDQIVQTVLTDSKNKQAVIMTWYQEFNYDTGFAQAHSKILKNSNDTYKKNMDKVIFLYDNIQVESHDIEMQMSDGEVDYAVFLNDAVAVDDSQRTEAEQIYFFPKTNILKAETDVKIVYADEEAPAYVFADAVIYEKEKNILSAFSKENKANSKIYRLGSFGEARQIILNLDDKQKPDNAILTGMAYSQLEDKALSGHELLFDIKGQKLKTLVGRPKTLLFAKNDSEGAEKDNQ